MAQSRAQIRQEIINNRTELGQTIRQLAGVDLKAMAQNRFEEAKPVLVARAREKAEELVPEARDKFLELRPVVAEQARAKWDQVKPIVAERSKEKGDEVRSLMMARATRKLAPIQGAVGTLAQELKGADYVEVVACLRAQSALLANKARAVLTERVEPALVNRLGQLTSGANHRPALKRGN